MRHFMREERHGFQSFGQPSYQILSVYPEVGQGRPTLTTLRKTVLGGGVEIVRGKKPIVGPFPCPQRHLMRRTALWQAKSTLAWILIALLDGFC